MAVKMIMQECCVMIVLVVITLFSFTESTSFSSSIFYKGMEVIVMISILDAVGSEFLVMITVLFSELVSLCQKKLENKKIFPTKKLAKERVKPLDAVEQAFWRLQHKKKPQEQLKINTRSLLRNKQNEGLQDNKKALKKDKMEDAWQLDESFDSGDQRGREKHIESNRTERMLLKRPKAKLLFDRGKFELGIKSGGDGRTLQKLQFFFQGKSKKQ